MQDLMSSSCPSFRFSLLPYAVVKVHAANLAARCVRRLTAPSRVGPDISVGRVVGSSGLEPPTSRLSGARSNQLSYEPTDQGTGPED